jgi:hypothetical protein
MLSFRGYISNSRFRQEPLKKSCDCLIGVGGLERNANSACWALRAYEQSSKHSKLVTSTLTKPGGVTGALRASGHVQPLDGESSVEPRTAHTDRCTDNSYNS